MKRRLLTSKVAQCSATEKMLQNINTDMYEAIPYPSIDAASKTLTIHSFTRNQQHSPLLRLPAELRNQIYTLLFSSLPILICFTTSYATRPIDPCPFPISKPRRWSHMHYSRLRLSLTEVCRQTYAETRLLPFALNTFTGYPEAMLSAFPGRLYRAQLDSITTVHLTVQSRDIGGDGNGCVRTKRVYLSWDLCSALRVMRVLSGLRTIRVVWDDGPLHTDVWERFREELTKKVVG